MGRKSLSAVAAALAIVAFAVPSTAGAAKVTCSVGILCAASTGTSPGEVISLTGTDVTLTTTVVGPITCATLALAAEIKVNNGTTVEASGNSFNPPQSGCKNGSHVVNVTEFKVSKLFSNDTTTNTIKKATISFTAKVDVDKVTCNFTGTNVPLTYDSGSSVIEASDSGGNTSDNCGTAKLDGRFTVEKFATSSTVILD